VAATPGFAVPVPGNYRPSFAAGAVRTVRVSAAADQGTSAQVV